MWSLDVNLMWLLLTLSLIHTNRLSWYFKSTTETLEKGVKYVQSQQ